MTVFAGTATIPATFQCDRQDVHALVVSIADQWIVYCRANFTGTALGIVRARWHTLPETLDGDGPFVYVSEIKEQIVHDYGTRTTTFEGGIGYVDVLNEREETDDRINAFSDYMRDVFTANARTIEAATGRSGMFEQYEGSDENPLQEGPYPFAHFMIRWRYVVQGGYR
jgi:hypothetical protein